MLEKQPIILSIQDLSCYGRSSLAVAIPVISATKVQVVPIPTAILSAHLGISGNVAVRSLDGYIEEALEHYKTINLDFNAIYSGYLDDSQQIEGVQSFWKAYPKAIKFVDPVMGDGGKPYSRITQEIQEKMKELVAGADIITPNLTEALILLGEKPQENLDINENLAVELTRALAGLGPKTVVLTGVKDGDDTIANYCFDKVKRESYCVASRCFPSSYAGTGDIFASIYIGTLTRTNDYRRALKVATGFLEYAVKHTYDRNGKSELGIMFEPCLDWLYKEDYNE